MTYETPEQKMLTVREVAVKLYEAKQRFTYADYLTWPNEERWELLNGLPFEMAAPTRKHQKIIGILHAAFFNYLKDKACEVYLAPFDVRLSDEDEEIDTVVQPDLSVFCDLTKLDNLGAKGAPDLIIEILSPSTSGYDKVVKMEIYRKHGVKEYWIIEPRMETIQVYILDENKHYRTRGYQAGEKIKVHILKDLEIDVKEVFQNE